MKRLFASRIWIGIITVALIGAPALAVYGVSGLDWRYGLPTRDKTAIVNTVMPACALALVGWGVIVALAAYISATGSPDLTFEIAFTFSRRPARPASERPSSPVALARSPVARWSRHRLPAGAGQPTGGSAAPGGLPPVGHGRLPPRSRRVPLASRLVLAVFPAPARDSPG